jgi:cyclic pyranopterin phosphate synthase
MLTHLDARNQPQMVDVGAKAITRRTAHAVATVSLPPELTRLIAGDEIQSKKGPVFQTAILAGIMGAKKTSDLIPLCHPLPLDDCKIQIETRPPAADGSADVIIHARATTHGKTGVEMEALTAASIAALTLYDMGKAVTHGIVIREIRLIEKTGGKSDYRAP